MCGGCGFELLKVAGLNAGGPVRAEDGNVEGGRLPNYFIVGTGKAGTTSLHAYLSQHPQIYMSPVKEPCYFAAEIRGQNLSEPVRRHVGKQSFHLADVVNDGLPVKPLGWLAGDWDDYLRLFQGVRDETAIGEASAAYLWSETAAAAIRSRIPEAKIVMILRDPAERAFSHYLHQLAVGLTRSTFREHIKKCEHVSHEELSIWYPFLEIGLYSQQVKRYLDLFPHENVRIYWYEEVWPQQGRLLADLFAFLDVDATFCPDTTRKSHKRRAPRIPRAHHFFKKHRLWYPLKALIPGSLQPHVQKLLFRSDSLTMEAGDRQYLVDYYRKDIGKLESLLGRDLSGWLG
jgi:hypothetical protein